MKKAFVVEKVGNGLLISITNEEGREEQYVVPKDDSLAFSMFSDAFEASATTMNSANVENDGGHAEEPESNSRNRKPTSDDYEDLLQNPAVRAGLGKAFDFLTSASEYIDKGRKG
jgi:hypothetical protein